MRAQAIFLNGVYRVVLEDILRIQRSLPEHIMYLQPYSGNRINFLAESPPSLDDPVRLLISTTEDLAKVEYAAEIVGWDDKTALDEAKWKVLNRVISTLQPTEPGLYDASRTPDKQSINLLHVRRMQRLRQPFAVGELVKTSDGQPVSEARTTAGGWAYVRNTFD